MKLKKLKQKTKIKNKKIYQISQFLKNPKILKYEPLNICKMSTKKKSKAPVQKQVKRGDVKMINWWNFVVGLVGTVGVIWDMPVSVGAWLVGVAFLILFISSFMEK